ncbi:MAG: heme lyase NrfEFG subunit NrfE, partial [Thalassobium sp.]
LMPWLVATALLHSLAVTEKRGLFKSWTVLLAIFAFSLSLLGTFLVRSGVLTSVHAFASDPERGIFILALLGICVGGSLLLYAIKAPTVASSGRFELVSREMFLLLNNLLLVVIALAILIGTLYPLVYDFMGLGKLSVGAAWFNTMFVPLSAGLAVVVGAGAMSRWKVDSLGRIGTMLWPAAIAAIVFAIITPMIISGELKGMVVLGLSVSIWLTLATFIDVWKKSRGQITRIPNLGMSYLGMILAHLGVAVTIVGVTMVANYSTEKSVRIAPGERETLGDYVFEFAQGGHITGPNYTSDAVRFNVYEDDKLISTLMAEKRRYTARGSVMTEAAIDVSLFRDLYVSMGEPLDNGAWGMRLQVKPFMRWVWLGAIFMACGGFLAMLDKRYRRRADKKVTAAKGAELGGVNA